MHDDSRKLRRRRSESDARDPDKGK
ncbi:uncharacterized protein METZ01_LOCUS266315, partial [marine metagenome]